MPLAPGTKLGPYEILAVIGAGGMEVDNYGTHKMPKVQRWFARRPRYHLHFTPTSASWLNQVEEMSLVTPARVAAGGTYFYVIGRLALGVTNQRAEIESGMLYQQYKRDDPGQYDATLDLKIRVLLRTKFRRLWQYQKGLPPYNGVPQEGTCPSGRNRGLWCSLNREAYSGAGDPGRADLNGRRAFRHIGRNPEVHLVAVHRTREAYGRKDLGGLSIHGHIDRRIDYSQRA